MLNTIQFQHFPIIINIIIIVLLTCCNEDIRISHEGYQRRTLLTLKVKKKTLNTNIILFLICMFYYVNKILLMMICIKTNHSDPRQ